ncbi:MAG: YadA-like family protein [Sodalis sp. (in: enterobacteria)]
MRNKILFAWIRKNFLKNKINFQQKGSVMNKIEFKYNLLYFLSFSGLCSFSKSYDLERLYMAIQFVHNKGIKMITGLSAEANLINSSKKKIKMLNTKILGSMPKINKYYVSIKDLKNSAHLGEVMFIKKISKNKDIQNKILLSHNIITLFHFIIITLSMLPHMATATNIVALGFSEQSYTMGEKALAVKPNSLALGYRAIAEQEHSVALGSHSVSTRQYTPELIKKITNELPLKIPVEDNLDYKYQYSEVSLGGPCGYSMLTRDRLIKLSQVTHLAPGIEETDAVNLFQTQSIVKNELEKLKLNTAEVHKKEINQLKNHINYPTQEIYSYTKRVADAMHSITNYQMQAKAMIEELHNTAAILTTHISQDDDGTMHIGKTLKGTTLSVSGKQGNRIISGVSEGIDNNDAANIAQLNQVNKTARFTYAIAQKNSSRINRLEHRLSKSNTKINHGLASAAALTGLFQPYNIGKVNVTAGIGGYSASQAIAVGSGYRINQNIAVKAGLAYSDQKNIMYNASFNLEW